VPSTPVMSTETATHSHTMDHGGDPWARKMVLGFDGGGLRGLSALIILTELMEKVQQYEEKLDRKIESSASPLPSEGWIRREESGRYRPSSFLPCHYFDYIGGTSTGGLMAVMLGRLRLDTDTALDIYWQLSSEMFLKDAGRLKSLFGSNVKDKRATALSKVLDDH